MSSIPKPRLLFLRFTQPDVQPFIRYHLAEQVRCLEQHFMVTVIEAAGEDYGELCERHAAELVIFESGIYSGARHMTNLGAHPSIPRLGFLHCDANCPSRKNATADMDAWGVSNFFTTAVALPAYTPEIADRCFVWPNFVDPEVYHDRHIEKVIPVLLTGSQAPQYPWRNRVSRIVSQRFPTMITPHFGWWNADGRGFRGKVLHGDDYARMISAASVAPTCGTTAMEVVRKHFEIPACGTCLVTEKSSALVAAGFEDGVNCVFAEDDVVEKIDWLLNSPDDLQRISAAGNRLVMQRHTMAQRSEVWQWFSLHKQLKSDERVVQAVPFGPLTIADAADRVAPVLQDPGRTDLALIQRADEAIVAGRIDEARGILLRCISLVGTMAEPALRLARVHLAAGDAAAAMTQMRTLLARSYAKNAAMEPDPVEWAHFLLCLVATGRTRQAMRYLKKYPDLQHPELSRMVRALLGIFDAANGAGVARPSAPQLQAGARRRASIHSMPLQNDAQWNAWLAGILRACGRLREAALLDAAAARDASERSDLGQARAPQSAAAPTNDGAGQPPRTANASSRRFRPVGNDLQTQLARAKRLLMRGLKPLARLLPEAFGQSRSVTPSQAFLCSVRDLLQQEPVASAICIGAAAQSPLTRTFIDGLRTNPNAVNLVLAEGSPKADWGGEVPPSGRFTRTELAQLLRKAEGPRPSVTDLHHPTAMSAFDLMAVDFSHAPHFELDAAGMSASLFVLSGLCTRNGHSAHEWLMRSNDYALVQFDALSENGYAVFRKRHWALASNGHLPRAQVKLPKFGVVS